jgi:hypothetical protein
VAGKAPRRGRRAGGGAAAAIGGALDALDEVYRAETSALRGWGEERARVLQQIGAVRAALRRAGEGEELRRAAAALVDLVGAPARPHGEPAPRRRRR